MRILVANVTGPTNIGDQYIVRGLIRILRKKYPKAMITMHSTDVSLYGAQDPIKQYAIKPTLYEWAVLEDMRIRKQIVRVPLVLLGFFLVRIGLGRLLPRRSMPWILFWDYQEVDLVVCVGGGYLRAHRKPGFGGVTQWFNIGFYSLMLRVARNTGKKAVVAPISFGPLAYGLQRWYVAKSLTGFDKVAAREEESFALLNEYQIPHVVQSPDTAFWFEDDIWKDMTQETHTIGFTIRPWFSGKKREEFERSYAEALADFCRAENLKVLPIVQGVSHLEDESDMKSTRYVSNILFEKGIEVLEPKVITRAEDAFNIYRSCDMIFGMRMHSNIIAAGLGVPFVAVGYEPKTRGIVQDLGMQRYHVEAFGMIKEDVQKLLHMCYENRAQISDALKQRVTNIREGSVVWVL